VAKATKNKKSKEGRHVGLDFYDLLIEVLYDGQTGSQCQLTLSHYKRAPLLE